MILKMLTNIRSVVDHLDTKRFKTLTIPNARELQQLGGVDSSAAQHHLASRDLSDFALLY